MFNDVLSILNNPNGLYLNVELFADNIKYVDEWGSGFEDHMVLRDSNEDVVYILYTWDLDAEHWIGESVDCTNSDRGNYDAPQTENWQPADVRKCTVQEFKEYIENVYHWDNKASKELYLQQFINKGIL